jgi:hypothetical protein
LDSVTQHDERVGTAAVLHGHAVHLDVERAAVGSLAARLDVARQAAQDLGLQAIALLVRLGRDELGAMPADHGLAGIAVHLEVGVVHVDDPVSFVLDHQRVDGRVEDRAVLLLARAQGLLRVLALRDVAHEREDPRLAADVGALEADLVPAQAAVLVATPPFERQAALALGLLDPLHRLVGRVGRIVRNEVGGRDLQQFLTRVATLLARARIDVDQRTGFPVVHVDRVFRGLEDLPVVRLGHAQHLGRCGALELGIHAHGEDPQHRLDERRLRKWPPRYDGDQAGGVFLAVEQRIPRITL